jgi:D-glycero-D-manno-heptose 1,7-bisphosphate phosphatase
VTDSFTRGKATPALLLDIDGTVREGKDDPLGRFVNGPDDVRVFPEAVERIRAWKAGGGRVVGLSNQGGVALGIVSYNKVAAAMVETHRQAGGLFDRLTFCVHHPDADNPEMARCWCRKPRPGLAIEALNDLGRQHPDEFYPPYMALMVGDRSEDKAMAEALNVDFMWAADWRAGR